MASVVKATPSGESTDRTTDADPDLEELFVVGDRVELKVGKRGGMERFPEELLGVLDPPVTPDAEFKRLPIRLVNQLGSWGTRSGLGGMILGWEVVLLLPLPADEFVLPIVCLGEAGLLKGLGLMRVRSKV